MGKSKHRKDHKEKLAKYKSNKKLEQDLLKKKMIENYLKMQQDTLANQQEHTSTEEVVGPEINLDDLNMVEDMIEDFEPINIEDSNIIDIETINIEDSNTIDIETIDIETIDIETIDIETIDIETIDAEIADIDAEWKKLEGQDFNQPLTKPIQL